MTTKRLNLNGHDLAYQRLAFDPPQDKPRHGKDSGKDSDQSPGSADGVIFLGGYASDMTGSKASFLAERCAEARIPFVRFDYRGCGASSGAFTEGSIGRWFEDALAVFDSLTEGRQIVIGSSMGGWLGLMLARDRPGRVAGLIGIAAAPDFTEDLIWPRLNAQQQRDVMDKGECYDETSTDPRRLPLTRLLFEDGRRHLVLRQKLKLDCPVHLLQGMRDEDVPWQHALRLIDVIDRPDVRLTLVKDGDHRLTRAEDLALLWDLVRG
jgi:pimeloyl-ACP methyl ester carboxylesterase